MEIILGVLPRRRGENKYFTWPTQPESIYNIPYFESLSLSLSRPSQAPKSMIGSPYSGIFIQEGLVSRRPPVKEEERPGYEEQNSFGAFLAPKSTKLAAGGLACLVVLTTLTLFIINMAGKKSRKRQTGSTKKVFKQSKNDGSVSVEEKRPKLDDGLEQQAEQFDQRVQEAPTVANTNNDLAEEESKYVPPFTRKPKRTLQRDRLNSVSPDLKSVRPKRLWKGKRISKETQQSFADQQSSADQQTNDTIRVEDSPKMIEKEKEQDIDVEALEEVTICTQENKHLVVFSTGQNTADELAVTTDEVLSSSMVSTVLEETSNIVMLVIENLFEAMYERINQCNNSEITSEFKEEPKAYVEEADTHSTVNIDIQVTDNSKEIDAISEEALKPNIETTAKPVILTKAAMKKIITGKTASRSVKNCKEVASSESQTTTLQQQQQQKQQQNQAITNKQQNISIEGHVYSTQETVISEGAFEKYGTGINNHAGETLENDNKGDLPYSLHQNENKTTVKQRGNSEIDNESDSQNHTITSKGEICANDSDAEPKNLATEGSPIINLEVKDAVSLNNTIPPVNEEVHVLSTSPIPIDKDLRSTDICCGNHVSEKEHHQQRASDDLLKSNEHTGMVHKTNMNTPMLENEVSSAAVSGNCGENANNICQMDIDQDLDQMVPNNCETTTAVLQESTDVEPFTRKPKRKEIDSEDSAGFCSKQQRSSPHVDKREDECHDLDEQVDKIPIVETGPTKKMNEFCQESPQLLKPSTVQASDVYVDQEPIAHEQIKMDTTITHVEFPLQSESFCKPKMETVELDQTMEDEITENQSSKVDAVCSLFGFDGDIMEFDSLMDCTDSQLVKVQDSSEENLLPDSHKHDSRQLLTKNNVAGDSTSSNGYNYSVEVPSDKGMIKGLISELSGLNKFIMGAWKDLENQKKRRQARLKLGKMKKLK